MLTAYCCAVFLLAGCLQGLTGFGAALAAVPLLCLAIDIKLAVGLCILQGMVINTVLVWRLRAHLDREKIMPLFLGSLPGALAGALCFKHVDPGLLKTLLGAFLLLHSVLSLAFRPRPLRPSPRWGCFAGFCTGIVASVLSGGGPPAIIYVALSGWPKEVMKATLAGFFFLNGVFLVAAYGMGGLVHPDAARLFLSGAPFILLGAVLGDRLGGRIRQETYRRVVLVALGLMGLVMLRPA